MKGGGFLAWFDEPPRYFFFTGKGGVGKTSLACATAVALADAGRRVLLVSTDPASNLDEVLRTPLSRDPSPIAEVPRLSALNIDPEAAGRAYREKVVGPLRGRLPDAVLRSIEEGLSGACTTEIAGFDAFARLLGEPRATTDFDHVVFDTAPTGHTLRLMLLPRAWTHFLDTNTSGTSCLGPLAGLDARRSVYAEAMRALADPARTVLLLVSRAVASALAEARRTRDELAAAGITNQRLILNGVFAAADSEDPTARAFEERGRAALAAHAGFLDSIPHLTVPLRPRDVLGVESLRGLFAPVARADGASAEGGPELPETLSPAALIDALAEHGRGAVLTMGKGGVGKTTVAAAFAVALAQRGHRVHLTTTDPAANVASLLPERIPGLSLGRIDPVEETAAYVAETLQTQGEGLDAEARALLEEDLRSPCTEEIAVFRAFAREVDRGRDGFVVLDTAPTGHTLLLLDATEAHHRELGRQSRAVIPEPVRALLPRLRDPDYCRVCLVTLPEATPVHEAASLQEDLRRAHIDPFAWIINQSLALTGTRDPLLLRRARAEARRFVEVVGGLGRRTVALPCLVDEPVGVEPLRRLLSPPTTHPIMTKFIYETVPASANDPRTAFEIEQPDDAAPLTLHPETGVAIRRVELPGLGPLRVHAGGEERGCCGPSGCCG